MSKKSTAVRAAFADATMTLPRPQDEFAGLRPEHPRHGYEAGRWPGAPADRLPPGCPVTPLGVRGDTYWYIDCLGQLSGVRAPEFSKKTLQSLTARDPYFLEWAWPRWSAPKANEPPGINGVETDRAMQCFMRVAADRGPFDPAGRVRGRGGWISGSGRFVWHAGDVLFVADPQGMYARQPDEFEGHIYPVLPRVTLPWLEPVDAAESPIARLYADLQTWNWERPKLDPVVVIGWLGCAFAGAALSFRPHIFTVGDKGTGKSTLHHVMKHMLGATLHTAADTTAAGVYQRVGQDCLPVAIDELEATADNRRVKAVMALARLASSGAEMFRGGDAHKGVEFQLRNAFFFSAVNPPPMEPADRSRLGMLILSRLDPMAPAPKGLSDDELSSLGRMMVRQIIDGFARWPALLERWRSAIRSQGIESRLQDTWGAFFAMAELLMGAAAMRAAGLPIDEPEALGRMVARATAGERADISENWIDCLGRLLGSAIEGWKSGERPSVGWVLDQLDKPGGAVDLQQAQDMLRLAGVGVIERDGRDQIYVAWVPPLDPSPQYQALMREWPVRKVRAIRRRLGDSYVASPVDRQAEGEDLVWRLTVAGVEEVTIVTETIDRRRLLAVPVSGIRSPALMRIYADTKWSEGVWRDALKQAPKDVVLRGEAHRPLVRINGQTLQCLLIDMRRFEEVAGG